MEAEENQALAARVVTLERRLRLYQCLGMGLGVVLLLGVSIAARPEAVSPDVIRATRLEIVDAAGRVVLQAGVHEDQSGGTLRLWDRAGQLMIGAYATKRGGRLEVVDPAGQETFSAGAQPGSDFPGLWERQLQAFERQRSDMERQSQEIGRLERQVHRREIRPSIVGADAQQERELNRQGRELDRQSRDIQRLAHELSTLSHRLRSVERR